MRRNLRYWLGFAAAVPIWLVVVFVWFLFISWALADELSECRRLAPKYDAALEVRLWDGTRVDLLNDEYAIEADWAPKWAEAIGQSLYYAELTQRMPGIILLVKDPDKDARYVYRCQTVCAKHGIRLWVERSVDE